MRVRIATLILSQNDRAPFGIERRFFVAQTATLHTNHGDIVIDLFPDQAPKTVANFVGLASGTKEYRDLQTGSRRPEATSTTA